MNKKIKTEISNSKAGNFARDNFYTHKGKIDKGRLPENIINQLNNLISLYDSFNQKNGEIYPTDDDLVELYDFFNNNINLFNEFLYTYYIIRHINENDKPILTLKINIEKIKELLNKTSKKSLIIENKENFEGKNMRGFNRIYYGTPGTGKSWNVNKIFNDFDFKRVTFHPEFTYFDFIGGLKPVVNEDESGDNVISYEFTPGPFTNVLVQAYKEVNRIYEETINNEEIYSSFKDIVGNNLSEDEIREVFIKDLKYYLYGKFDKIDKDYMGSVESFFNENIESRQSFGLIIEEINRANTAAVFGDIFQLLDREKGGASEYPIENIDLIKHLKKELKDDYISEVIIPSNFSIVATMNSSDQGVFVMDSAFKRRWEFEYVPIDFDSCIHGNITMSGFKVLWKEFGKMLNQTLSKIGIEEDKLIGPYFLKEEDLRNMDKISSKLLIYLWDDVVRYKKRELFVEDYYQFQDIVAGFKKGNKIFKGDIQDYLDGKISNEEDNNKIDENENDIEINVDDL